MEEREGIKLGYIYFDGGGVESDWTEPILGIHTGCTGGSPDKDFMDLYTPRGIIRYYPNAASGLGKFFTVNYDEYNPNILEMYSDKNEIFNVKKVDLFSVCRMMNNVNVIDDDIVDADEEVDVQPEKNDSSANLEARIKELEGHVEQIEEMWDWYLDNIYFKRYD